MAIIDDQTEATKEKLFREMFPSGTILHLYCDFTKPPKNKYLILLTYEPTPLMFFINSEPLPYINKRPKLVGTQCIIDHIEYSFLKYDSFIDCSKVEKRIDDTELKKQNSNGKTCIIGKIKKALAIKMISAIESNPNFSRIIKNEYIKYLNNII